MKWAILCEHDCVWENNGSSRCDSGRDQEFGRSLAWPEFIGKAMDLAHDLVLESKQDAKWVILCEGDCAFEKIMGALDATRDAITRWAEVGNGENAFARLCI